MIRWGEHAVSNRSKLMIMHIYEPGKIHSYYIVGNDKSHFGNYIKHHTTMMMQMIRAYRGIKHTESNSKTCGKVFHYVRGKYFFRSIGDMLDGFLRLKDEEVVNEISAFCSGEMNGCYVMIDVKNINCYDASGSIPQKSFCLSPIVA